MFSKHVTKHNLKMLLWNRSAVEWYTNINTDAQFIWYRYAYDMNIDIDMYVWYACIRMRIIDREIDIYIHKCTIMDRV